MITQIFNKFRVSTSLLDNLSSWLAMLKRVLHLLVVISIWNDDDDDDGDDDATWLTQNIDPTVKKSSCSIHFFLEDGNG